MSRKSRKSPGRPKLGSGEKRETIMRFVVTGAEAGKIRGKAKASGLTISEYLRSVAIPKE